MKKIVYIGKYNGIVGGIERYMQSSAELLRRSGFSVHLLYTENAGRNQDHFAASFDSVSEFAEGCPLPEHSDLVILHNILPAEMLKLLPQDKTFFFAHDHNIYCRRHHYYTPLGRTNCHGKYNKLRCMFCSLFRNEAPPLEAYCKFPALVLSDFMKDNLLKNGFEKVVKLPAFIRSKGRTFPFMPDGILRILFLGQLIRGKGADLMLKTLAKLSIPFQCTIAGDGKDRLLLEQMVKDLGLLQKVRFEGFVSDPELLWENHDLFFFPIRWQEPFGLVGLEAMAHGVPLVAFDLGGVREYLTDECGALVPEKDLTSAAKIITDYYMDPSLLKKHGEYGTFLAKERFSEECFIREFSKLQENMR